MRPVGTSRFDCLMNVKYAVSRAAIGEAAGGPSFVMKLITRYKSEGDSAGACLSCLPRVLAIPLFSRAEAFELNNSPSPPAATTQLLAPDIMLYMLAGDKFCSAR